MTSGNKNNFLCLKTTSQDSQETIFCRKFLENFDAPGKSILHFQKLRKRVGGQRGLAQGNPSHAIDSRMFFCPLLPMPPYE